MIFLGVIIAALLTSALYAVYIRSVGNNKAVIAATSDLGIMLMSTMSIQAWALTNNDIRVLLVYDAMAAIGTYIAVKFASPRVR